MNDTRLDFAEKRSFRRMYLGTQAELKNSQGQIYSGLCANLSATGLLLDADTGFNINEELQVSIPSPTPNMPGYKARCRVNRSDAHGTRFHVGLEVLEVL